MSRSTKATPALALAHALALALACGGETPADRVRLLAEGWSGAAAAPICRATGPAGEALGSPESRYCEYLRQAPGQGDRLDLVTGPPGARATWDRQMIDGGDASRLTDSLRQALVARGLSEAACPTRRNLSAESSGVRFSGDSLVVDVVTVAFFTRAPRVVVTAVTDAAELANGVCDPARAATP